MTQTDYRLEMTARISNDDMESFAVYKEKNQKLNKFLLESSKEIIMVGSDNNEEDLGEREERQFVVSTTTTLTSYSILSVVAAIKSISISPAPAMGTSLYCLPPGLKTC